jgi:hypothetical protein
MSGRSRPPGGEDRPDLQRSSTGRVTLLDDLEVVGATSVSTPRRSKLRPLLVALAILIVPVAIAALTFGSTNPTDPADTAEGEPPGNSGSIEAATPAEEFDELRAYGSGGIEPDNRYSGINGALDAVVVAGTVGSGPGQALQLYGPAPRLDIFPPGNRALEEMSFDASGNWLAGVYKNTFQQDVLMVGRPEGGNWVMDPVAVDLNGYAWHPTDPGVIAFAKLNNLAPTVTDIVSEDYTKRRVISRRFRAEFPGRLRIWGDWGMAFDQPGPTPLTTVATYELDPSSLAATVVDVLASGIPGSALGQLGPNRILIDGADTPTIVNTDNAVFEQNQWIEPGTEVAAMSGSPDGKFSVALVVERGRDDSLGGDVVLLASEPTSDEDSNDLLFSVAGPTTFDWTPDGRFVAGYESAELDADGQRRSAAAVTVYDLDRSLYVGREIRESVGGDLDLRFRANAVAFQETLND